MELRREEVRITRNTVGDSKHGAFGTGLRSTQRREAVHIPKRQVLRVPAAQMQEGRTMAGLWPLFKKCKWTEEEMAEGERWQTSDDGDLILWFGDAVSDRTVRAGVLAALPEIDFQLFDGTAIHDKARLANVRAKPANEAKQLALFNGVAFEAGYDVFAREGKSAGSTTIKRVLKGKDLVLSKPNCMALVLQVEREHNESLGVSVCAVQTPRTAPGGIKLGADDGRKKWRADDWAARLAELIQVIGLGELHKVEGAAAAQFRDNSLSRWVDATPDALEISWCVAEEDVPLCLCRRRHVHGVHAGMIACKRCANVRGPAQAWYHYDCMGMSRARFETEAQGKEYLCPACVRHSHGRDATAWVTNTTRDTSAYMFKIREDMCMCFELEFNHNVLDPGHGSDGWTLPACLLGYWRRDRSARGVAECMVGDGAQGARQHESARV